jgi:hypothetical protein
MRHAHMHVAVPAGIRSIDPLYLLHGTLSLLLLVVHMQS